jgi:hypothetical protein
MRLKTAVIGPTTYKTFRKELLVLILGQPPRDRADGDEEGQTKHQPAHGDTPLPQ